MTDEEFTRIALKYSDSIFRIAFNYCRNRADSDDIVQNVLLKYYKCDKVFESEEHIRNWLIRVAVNESKKLIVSPFKKKTVPIEELNDTLTFEHKEESDLYYAVMELPKKYRVTVYMYYYEDYSVNEIADILKENPSTIRTRLMRAREKLRTTLQGVWTDEQ
ncbi:MAG: RNA polymerase sigma factor [Acutalibacteraceae bacterium]